MKSRRRKCASLFWALLALSFFGDSGFAQEPTKAVPAKLENAQGDHSRSVIDVNFDDIKFEMEKGTKFSEEMLTEKIRSYDGKVLRIRGFIRPSFKQSGLTKFVFVRDNQECCFGPGAMLYDCIIVEMDGDKSIDFSTRPISVRGKFEVDTETFKYPDGTYYAIFKLKATEVK